VKIIRKIKIICLLYIVQQKVSFHRTDASKKKKSKRYDYILELFFSSG